MACFPLSASSVPYIFGESPSPPDPPLVNLHAAHGIQVPDASGLGYLANVTTSAAKPGGVVATSGRPAGWGKHHDVLGSPKKQVATGIGRGGVGRVFGPVRLTIPAKGVTGPLVM